MYVVYLLNNVCNIPNNANGWLFNSLVAEFLKVIHGALLNNDHLNTLMMIHAEFLPMMFWENMNFIPMQYGHKCGHQLH